MTLEEYCKTLDETRLINLAVDLCETAIPIWETYCAENKTEYIDTVVGMHHTVRKELLADTLQIIKTLLAPHDAEAESNKISTLLEEFVDPIISLQDMDWDLPEEVKLTFYSVYNLASGRFDKITLFDEATLYVAVNQAIDAIQTAGLLSLDEIKRKVYG